MNGSDCLQRTVNMSRLGGICSLGSHLPSLRPSISPGSISGAGAHPPPPPLSFPSPFIARLPLFFLSKNSSCPSPSPHLRCAEIKERVVSRAEPAFICARMRQKAACFSVLQAVSCVFIFPVVFTQMLVFSLLLALASHEVSSSCQDMGFEVVLSRGNH